MRVDLHVHSKYSTRPSQWFLQKIGCPESFSEPLEIYRIAQQRGMDLITITDHNRIDGALEIAHLPGTFLSEEITSYFPEDNCKVHVLAYHITAEQHEFIQKVRNNLYDLVGYLQRAHIIHALAHPFYSINDQLGIMHFEKLLLLFKNFELNGDCNPEANECLKNILSNLKSEDIAELTAKHRIIPGFAEPWQKNFVGGTDDHSSLNIARTYTEVLDADSPQSFLLGIENNKAKVVCLPSSPLSMARNLYSLAYQFYRKKLGLGPFVPNDFILRFIDRCLKPTEAVESSLISKLNFLWQYRRLKKITNSIPKSLSKLFREESLKLISEEPQIFSLPENGNGSPQKIEAKWFNFVTKVSDRIILQFANHLLDHFSGASLFNIFQTIGSAGGLYTLMVPYFVAFSHYTHLRRFQRIAQERFLKGKDLQVGTCDSKKVAVFTATVADGNELALALQREIPSAGQSIGELTFITCNLEDHIVRKGVRNFKPIGVYEISDDPEQKIFYPPLMEMLAYSYNQNFTSIHTATTGPVGLAALIVAQLLKVPINATHHTSLPQYAHFITKDGFMEDLAWKYTIWFYNQMDKVYVSLIQDRDELIHKGISPRKICLVPVCKDMAPDLTETQHGHLPKRFETKESRIVL